MKNVINDQKVIQEMCVDIMSAGAIPDAGNIQAYLNIRKDLWDGPDDVSIYSLSINHSRYELGNKSVLWKSRPYRITSDFAVNGLALRQTNWPWKRYYANF